MVFEIPHELGLLSSLIMVPLTGELCTSLFEAISILLLRLCLALSTFLSLNLSCNKLFPVPLAPVFLGRFVVELFEELGVILVMELALDSGRGGTRDLREP